MSEALDLLVDGIACYRLTKIIAWDTIGDHARAAVVRWAYKRAGVDHGSLTDVQVLEAVREDDNGPMLATLVTCRWCSSVWLGAAIVVARRFRWWKPVRDVLAFSAAAGLLERLEA